MTHVDPCPDALDFDYPTIFMRATGKDADHLVVGFFKVL